MKVSMTSIPKSKAEARRELELARDAFEIAGGTVTVLPNGLTGDPINQPQKLTKTESIDRMRRRTIKQQKTKAEKSAIRERTRPLKNNYKKIAEEAV